MTVMSGIKPRSERPLHILLVEDEPNDQTLFCAAASKTRLNLRIQAVANGQEALEYLEGRGSYVDRILHPLPDVLVLDLRMPVMDGFEVLAWCQTSPVFRSLPVVALSGSLDEQWMDRALAMGASQFFLKPACLGDWGAIVRQIWEFARAGSPAPEPAASQF